MAGFTGTRRLASGRWAAFQDGALIGTSSTEEAARVALVGDHVAAQQAREHAERVARNEARSPERQCRGGVCIDILQQCSRHSQEYQARYGRASNE